MKGIGYLAAAFVVFLVLMTVMHYAFGALGVLAAEFLAIFCGGVVLWRNV